MHTLSPGTLPVHIAGERPVFDCLDGTSVSEPVLLRPGVWDVTITSPAGHVRLEQQIDGVWRVDMPGPPPVEGDPETVWIEAEDGTVL